MGSSRDLVRRDHTPPTPRRNGPGAAGGRSRSTRRTVDALRADRAAQLLERDFAIAAYADADSDAAGALHVVASRLGDDPKVVLATYAHLLPHSDEMAAAAVAAQLVDNPLTASTA
jgi:hypothetical protein